MHGDVGVGLGPEALDFRFDERVTVGQVRHNHVELVESWRNQSGPVDAGLHTADMDRGADGQRGSLREGLPGGNGRIGLSETGSEKQDDIARLSRPRYQARAKVRLADIRSVCIDGRNILPPFRAEHIGSLLQQDPPATTFAREVVEWYHKAAAAEQEQQKADQQKKQEEQQPPAKQEQPPPPQKQQEQQKKDKKDQKNQPKFSKDQVQEAQVLVTLVDNVTAGKQPAPSDIPVAFYHHFMRSREGKAFMPYTLTIDPATGDTLNPWRTTTSTDSTFIVSADIPGLPQDAGVPLRDQRFYQSHTLFIRAVDDDDAVRLDTRGAANHEEPLTVWRYVVDHVAGSASCGWRRSDRKQAGWLTRGEGLSRLNEHRHDGAVVG